MNKSDSIDKITPAFLRVLAEVTNPIFDSQNPHFRNKYASMESVRETVNPVLARHGMGQFQLLGSRDGLVTCETVLLHESGQWISEVFALPSAKQDAQGFGSAATYARRYSLMAALGIVGEEDDDGAAASPEQKRQSSKRPAQTPKAEQEGDEKPSTGLLFGRGRKYKQWDGQQVAKWVKEEFGCYINSLTPEQMADACRRLKEGA